ncbi:hypothetical protein ACVWY5_000182 [Bradyrhizobium sp. USDA 3256]
MDRPAQEAFSSISLQVHVRCSDERRTVSAHPNVFLKMGTKEVLYRTRSRGWGSDKALYQTAEARRSATLRAMLGRRLSIWRMLKSHEISRSAGADAYASVGPSSPAD